MDCTVKGNLPSEIFEDIKKIADNSMNFQQLKNKTVFVSDCHGLIAYYIICTLLEGNDFFGNNTRVITLAKSREAAEKQFGSLTLRKDFVTEIGESKNFPEIERADFVIYCNCPCEVAEEDCSNPEIADTITSGFANVLEYANRFCSYLHIWFTGRFSAVKITFAKTTSAILIRPMPTVHTHKVCVQPKHLLFAMLKSSV